MIKYKNKASHLKPGFTYYFEWDDKSTFEGIYLRMNAKNSNVFLFKLLNKSGDPKIYTPESETLKECVWINQGSWKGIKDIWEVNKPDFVKPEFDKKEEFAAALVFSGLPMHGMSVCPKCGKEGKFVRMALICPDHGAYAGC